MQPWVGTTLKWPRIIAGVKFLLSTCDFGQIEEPNAMMEIRVAKNGILGNPVVFRVTPMTVVEAERLGIMNLTRPADDYVSPSIAGKFNKCMLHCMQKGVPIDWMKYWTGQNSLYLHV